MWNLISCSKITEQRIRQKSYDQHINKINKMKSTIKINEPQQPWFIYAKKKKQLKRAQELLDIQKHNHLLLSKIKNIQSRQNDTFKKNVYLTTLNGKIMQQANIQIFKENKRICEKIIKTKAFYKTGSILQSSNNLQRVMQNISLNARRVQSAKSLASSKSKILRPQSVYTQRPQSSIQPRTYSEFRQRMLSSSTQKKGSLTRPSSAPSIKKIKINIQNPNVQTSQKKQVQLNTKIQNEGQHMLTQQKI